MVSTCLYSFLFRAIVLSSFSLRQSSGGLLFPLPSRRQCRDSDSSSFTPAPFHSVAKSCYKKHNSLEFDHLPDWSWLKDRPLSYPVLSSFLSYLATCKGHAV